MSINFLILHGKRTIRDNRKRVN
uniref:Uncharacterized protein n=1 Tax=Arundo donax TaxID=35708 RepID=A0A0A9U328_ARUDO